MGTHLAARTVEIGDIEARKGFDSRGSQVHKALLRADALCTAVCNQQRTQL